jgi:hypothetical protein
MYETKDLTKVNSHPVEKQSFFASGICEFAVDSHLNFARMPSKSLYLGTSGPANG